jgi:peptidoglycan/xylan/chitin deacetylase (PgdA/CDA1 family)
MIAAHAARLRAAVAGNALTALLLLGIAPALALSAHGAQAARPAGARRTVLQIELAGIEPVGIAVAEPRPPGSAGAPAEPGTPGKGGVPTGTGTTPTTPGSTGKPVAPKPVALYRIVGCRSRGSSDYFHGPYAREVAIGFDDGPAADTSAFVSMLERARARATFFMIGEQVNSGYRNLLLRELRDGDVLGDHTYTHPDLTRIGGVREQLQRTLEVIRGVSGYTPCVFRPPYGAVDSSVVQTARSLGLATVLWNVDPSDYALPGTGAIVQRVLAQVQRGSIIISHDGGGPRGETLAAYPAIISALRARGYRIVTIPELLGFRPVYRACIKLCAGIGLPRSKLPRGAIAERAP